MGWDKIAIPSHSYNRFEIQYMCVYIYIYIYILATSTLIH